jgi:hypothetical protein
MLLVVLYTKISFCQAGYLTPDDVFFGRRSYDLQNAEINCILQEAIDRRIGRLRPPTPDTPYMLASKTASSA